MKWNDLFLSITSSLMIGNRLHALASQGANDRLSDELVKSSTKSAEISQVEKSFQ